MDQIIPLTTRTNVAPPLYRWYVIALTGAMGRQRKSELAVDVGLVANIVLAGAKTVVGLWGRSPALFADGINSVSDVVYYIVVKIFTKLAGKPPDREHPYGHRQFETISAVVVGAFVICTGIAIFWDSVSKAYRVLSQTGSLEKTSLIALYVALGTVVIKLGLTYWTRRLAKQTNNPAVLALAADHRNDVAAAGAAAIGIFVGQLGYYWVDPAAGALVALFVLRTGVEILRESSMDLMYAVPGESLAKQIFQSAQAVSGVLGIEEIHVHRFGPYVIVNLTIGVDGQATVASGDRIATSVERHILEKNDLVKRVFVHFHPSNGQGLDYPTTEQ